MVLWQIWDQLGGPSGTVANRGSVLVVLWQTLDQLGGPSGAVANLGSTRWP